MQFVIRVISLGVVALLTSCYLKHIDLEERGVTLAVTPEGNVSVSAVSAYQDGEHLLVSGSIGHKRAIRPFSGWVHVSVFLENGEVFEESCGRVFPKPELRRYGSIENMYTSFFGVTLPKVPPSGSVIRVVGSARASFCT
jgi:hypothetical protein